MSHTVQLFVVYMLMPWIHIMLESTQSVRVWTPRQYMGWADSRHRFDT